MIVLNSAPSCVVTSSSCNWTFNFSTRSWGVSSLQIAYSRMEFLSRWCIGSRCSSSGLGLGERSLPGFCLANPDLVDTWDMFKACICSMTCCWETTFEGVSFEAESSGLNCLFLSLSCFSRLGVSSKWSALELVARFFSCLWRLWSASLEICICFCSGFSMSSSFVPFNA